MKLSELHRVLGGCLKKWGDLEVYMFDDHGDLGQSIESIEYDGEKIILGDLQREKENEATADDRLFIATGPKKDQ